MTPAVRVLPAAGRVFSPYDGFANAYPDGDAAIARLVGPEISETIGGGIVRYGRIKTLWELPFDEIVYVIEGAMEVRCGAEIWHVSAGDVLFFPKLMPIEYDVATSVTVFYAKFPI